MERLWDYNPLNAHTYCMWTNKRVLCNSVGNDDVSNSAAKHLSQTGPGLVFSHFIGKQCRACSNAVAQLVKNSLSDLGIARTNVVSSRVVIVKSDEEHLVGVALSELADVSEEVVDRLAVTAE